jgi:hypothetical protein
MNWKGALTALVLLILNPAGGSAEENCTNCHRVALQGAHAEISCVSCHGTCDALVRRPSAAKRMASGCTQCHEGFDALFAGPMTTRLQEKQFVEKTYGQMDPHFFQANCASCHVADCLDCHGSDGHAIGRPAKDACSSCHKGYYVGADYYGRAPREDNLRYQRGVSYKGDTYLTMRPDVHADAGMECGECHSMQSLVAGHTSSKKCVDCHQPDETVVEHANIIHLSNLECSACHAAWAAQEYGTFYVRMINSPMEKYFRVKRQYASPYVKSAYLRKQDMPPLGINENGKVSPIRPQFISFFSDIRKGKPVGEENRLLAAQWKAFSPHSIQRGTVMCDSCHNNPRRFVLEKEEDRIYQLPSDGLALPSFWDQTGQEVINGSFMDISRFAEMSSQKQAYIEAYLKKWKNLMDHVEDSSKP